MNSAARPQNSPIDLPPSLSPSSDTPTTTKDHGSQSRNASIPSRAASMTVEIGLKSQAKASPIHLKKSSIGSWMAGSQLRGQSPNSVFASEAASE